MITIVVTLTNGCQFDECSEMSVQEMVEHLLGNQQIPMPVKKRILIATFMYMETEMDKFTSPTRLQICPPDFPKELCQMPSTFYVWMRKLRDDMVLDEVNKSKISILNLTFLHLKFQ